MDPGKKIIFTDDNLFNYLLNRLPEDYRIISEVINS